MIAFAKANLRKYDTSKVCEILNVSRSGYYKAIRAEKREDSEIEKQVIHCFQRHGGNYGRIRIRKELLRYGVEVSEYRISGILRRNGLEAKGGRSGKRHRPRPSPERYIEENLIRDKFSVTEPNYLWCSDITEMKVKGGKLYVCGVIDVATRRIVGWAIDRRMTQEVVQRAIELAAIRNPERPEGAIFHSDRGSQYTAKRTKEQVESLGFRKSMSRPGKPNDNQAIESFWHTLKRELGDMRTESFEEARAKISAYIETYYNPVRLHSGIGYSAPSTFFSLLGVH